MKKKIILITPLLAICCSYGPPNCNLYNSDPECYQACQEAEHAVMHRQGSVASQSHFDNSIKLCPTFDYSYYEKSVPFAKRGLIVEWKNLIDQAIALKPEEYLGIRGWYHFFFMHNYKAAIDDIELLDSLVSYDIGVSGDGVYHLNVIKALCWNGLGKPHQAIDVLLEQMHNTDHYVGIYDYLHLGKLYLDISKFELANDCFEKQRQVNDISEIYYYKSLMYKQLGKYKEQEAALQIALEYYKNSRTMNNPYHQLTHEIYLSDIEYELGNIES